MSCERSYNREEEKMRNISKMGANGNLWERSALGLGYSISRKNSRSSIPFLEDNGSESIDLPGSVTEMKDEFNNYPTCVIKNTNIDEQSDQITQVSPAKESFMKRLSMRIKQLLPFRQLTTQNRNDPASNEVILTSFSHRKKRERIEGTSEDHMPEAKAYIPYECARFHIAKVVEDMHQLRNKYIKHICEIEESLHTPEKEKKEQSILKLQKQHRDKMTVFKEVLKAYQERIKKNNKYWEDLVQHLKNENNQLLQEKIQAKQELEKWEYQKTKIIERYSQKIDLLYTHQISTLKELHITRLELERVQEMLKPQEEIVPEKQEKYCLQATSEIKISDDPDFEGQNFSQEVHEQRQTLKNCVTTLGETEHTGNERWATVIGPPEETQEEEGSSSASEASKEYFQEKACVILPSSSKRENNCSGTDQTKIAEAQMILEKLKQNLIEKEEEITELLQDKNQPGNHLTTWTKNQLVHSDPSSIFLLKKILEKFHSVYSEVPETRQFIDCLLNENNGKVITAKETLKRLQQNVIDSKHIMGGYPTDFNRFQFPKEPCRSLEDVQAELWEAEMAVGALGSIRSGCVNEQLYSIVTGSKSRCEAEMWLKLEQKEMMHKRANDDNINFGQSYGLGPHDPSSRCQSVCVPGDDSRAGINRAQEANLANKSLGSLGDAIFTFLAEQSLLPFRNNKFTLPMQDSLRGNSKRFMSMDILPAESNTEENTSSKVMHLAFSRSQIMQRDSETKEIPQPKLVVRPHNKL